MTKSLFCYKFSRNGENEIFRIKVKKKCQEIKSRKILSATLTIADLSLCKKWLICQQEDNLHNNARFFGWHYLLLQTIILKYIKHVSGSKIFEITIYLSIFMNVRRINPQNFGTCGFKWLPREIKNW